MRSTGQPKSSFERRLKELQQEEAALQKDIRNLKNFVTHPEDDQPDAQAKPSFFAKFFPPQKTPSADSSPMPEPQPRAMQPVAPTSPPPREFPNDGDAKYFPQASNATAAVAPTPDKKPRVDDKFAAYITTGSFMPATGCGRRQRPIQRNRAIFMVIVLIAALIIVMQIFRFIEW